MKKPNKNGQRYRVLEDNGGMRVVGKSKSALLPILKDFTSQVTGLLLLRGGAGSGNWGHSGRPGQVGGSGAGGGALRYPPANPNGADTEARYKRADGSWTPERAALHEKIIAHFLKEATPVANPVSYMMGGGAASGKSVAIKSGSVNMPENRVDIDPDAIKAQIPEFQQAVRKKDPKGAGFTHEESSYLAGQILDRAIKGSYNTMLDGVGDSGMEKLASKVAKMREGGRKVVANYVTVDVETAAARNQARFEKTGRKVPDEALRGGHKAVSQLVPQLLEKGLFDEINLFDTNGNGSRLVVSAKGKDVTIHDRELYDRFLKKGE